MPDPIDPLFGAHATLRAVIECGLEGILGRVVAPGSPPRAARIDLGCYAIFGGDATTDDAERLVREVEAPRELLVGEDQRWRDLLLRVHGDRMEDRPMRTFSPHALEPDRLRTLAERLPDGFSLRRIDAGGAALLDDGLVPHGMQTFADPADFAARGLGFGVFADGALASAATSYAVSSSRVEVAIATRERFRGHGLARAVSAAMLRHCLDAGLRPEWSAANPISKRLALGLGYRPAAMCDVFLLPAESPPAPGRPAAGER